MFTNRRLLGRPKKIIFEVSPFMMGRLSPCPPIRRPCARTVALDLDDALTAQTIALYRSVISERMKEIEGKFKHTGKKQWEVVTWNGLVTSIMSRQHFTRSQSFEQDSVTARSKASATILMLYMWFRWEYFEEFRQSITNCSSNVTSSNEQFHALRSLHLSNFSNFKAQ